MADAIHAEVAVVGGGLIGSAAAYGLARRGVKTVLLDGDDADIRSARANFGLVWVQGKGMDMPAYQRLTRLSSNRWPEFAARLAEESGIGFDYRRDGGLTVALGEAEFAERSAYVERLRTQFGTNDYDTEMVERTALERLLPEVTLGPEVVGASYCWRDGHLNPLALLRALQVAFLRFGGRLERRARVEAISREGGTFLARTARGEVRSDRLLVAAGSKSAAIAREVGIDVPVRPQRGQVMITERMPPMLPLPITGVRQTGEGTYLVGGTQEEVGFDTSTRVADAANMADRAVRVLPALENVNLVRHWAGLRVMTPDSYPIYEESQTMPGAFVALCHSGATLCAAHAEALAETMATGAIAPDIAGFDHRRFDV
ncbi:NAD(P)/FAD-dependent oxidoreductase [Acuticoccus mangrovi]|uniref:FAD-binding oxidoreductase n=1 Tax=Acuticoccus mangrovi TaxID=2796142 RepID=A0A934IQ46_9HYPH|nr:FAD-binding oxidoreductase [Acuticoccus mangrovi]MBJ3776558.1 FAD-binding oxidoreductase [Acuticoccus mangrovi]